MDERKAGVVLGYLHVVVQSLIGIFYIPIVLRIVGNAEYGLYQIVASIISCFSILESMLSASVLRHYSLFLAQNNKEKIENLLYTARRLFFYISLFIFVLSVPVGYGIITFFSDSLTNKEITELLLMYALLIINLVISINGYVYVACITANQKFVFLKVSGIIAMILQPLSVVLLLEKYPYTLIIVIVQVALNIVVTFIRYFYCKSKLGIVVKRHERNNSQLAKELLAFSVGVLMAVIADTIFWKTDQIILGKFHGTIPVAIYSVGASIFNMYMMFASALGAVQLPTVIRKTELEGIQSADALFRKIGRIQFLLMGVVVVGFYSFGNEFITLWVGKEYAISYTIALLLMVPYLIDIVQCTGLSILQATNHYSFRAKCMLVIAVINVLLTIILAKKSGLIGAAISTSISIVIGPGFIMNWYYWKKIGLDIPKFWRECFPICLFLIAFMLVGKAISHVYVANALISFVVHVILFVIVYCVMAYLVVMNDFEKKQLLVMLKKL